MRRFINSLVFVALLFSFAGVGLAATKYVRVGGSDSNACTNSGADACLTTAKALTVMSSGDTMDIGAGTFTSTWASSAIPTGTSESARTIIEGAGEGVTILRPSGNNDRTDAISVGLNKAYITFRELSIEGDNVSNIAFSMTDNSHHIRLDNVLVGDAPLSSQIGMRDESASDDKHHLEVIDSEVRCVGNDDFDHGIYGRMRDVTIEGTYVHGCLGFTIRVDIPASGIGPDRWIVRRNRLTDSGYGVNFNNGVDHIFYDNLVYAIDNDAAGYPLSLNGGVARVLIDNNTIFGNTGRCMWLLQADFTSIRNNICWSNGTNTIDNSGGTNTTSSNNLCTTGCAVSADPLFTSSGTGDFSIPTTSPAKDTGTAVAHVTTDYIGTPRPQPSGGSYDIGAYEFFAGGDPGRISVATDTFTTATATQCINLYDSTNWTTKYTSGSATNCALIDPTPDVAFSNTSNNYIPWWAVHNGTYQNDQYSSATLSAIPSVDGTQIGVLCRASTDIDANRDGYEAILTPGNIIYFNRVQNGVHTLLGGNSSETWAVNDEFECDAVGNQIRVLRNGTALITVSDSVLTTGKPGIVALGASDGAITAWEGGQFDEPDPPAGTITLSLPAAGGVYLRPNPSIPVEWTTQNTSGTVSVCTSPNNGTSWELVADVAYNSSPYVATGNWPRSTTTKVCVEQNAGTCNCSGGVQGTSGAFTIIGVYVK